MLRGRLLLPFRVHLKLAEEARRWKTAVGGAGAVVFGLMLVGVLLLGAKRGWGQRLWQMLPLQAAGEQSPCDRLRQETTKKSR